MSLKKLIITACLLNVSVNAQTGAGADTQTVEGIQITPGISYVHNIDPIDDTNRSAIYLGTGPTLVISCADGDQRRIWSYVEGAGQGSPQNAWVRIGKGNSVKYGPSRLTDLGNGGIGFDGSITRQIVNALKLSKQVTLRTDNDARTTLVITPGKNFNLAWSKVGGCQSH